MNRIKTFVATGVAPDGRLFAGDLNAIQDAAAGLTNFSQTISLQELKVGDSGLGITKFGSGEFQMSGSVRTSATGILKGLGGLFAGTYTTTQRNAISGPLYGLVILNTTTNRLEWNMGTTIVPNWQPLTKATDDALTAAVASLTASKLDLAAIPGAWTSFTPVLLGSGGNPNYGTGSAAGRWMKIGRTVYFKMIFRWVGGTPGSGFYTVNVPAGAGNVPLEWGLSSIAKVHCGNWACIFNDASEVDGWVSLKDTDEFFLSYRDPVAGGANTNLGAPGVSPQTISLSGFYETTT